MDRTDLQARLEACHPAAFGWALNCCGWDRSLAEDALQTAYLKVLQGRARFDGRASFKTWLFAVIRRTAADERRRLALRRFVPLSMLDGRSAAAGSRPDLEGAIARSQDNERLVQALSTLPARQRDLLHLVFYQDLSIAQAADVLGIAVGTARTHYERGKRRLRGLLAEDVRE